eukprot:671459-Pelagomonas_calceolata.AAC.1
MHLPGTSPPARAVGACGGPHAGRPPQLPPTSFFFHAHHLTKHSPGTSPAARAAGACGGPRAGWPPQQSTAVRNRGLRCRRTWPGRHAAWPVH